MEFFAENCVNFRTLNNFSDHTFRVNCSGKPSIRSSTLENARYRLPVNSSHGQLVTRSTRHTVNSSQVNSSPGPLVTQSTRHKEAVNSSQANIKAVLPMYWSPNFLAVVFKKQKKFPASSHQNAGLYV